MLFRSATHQQVWRGRWCDTCFQPDEATKRIQGKGDGCPILARALRTGRKPVEWDRNPRATELERTIKCHEYQKKPALNRRQSHTEEGEPMLFTAESFDAPYVPVEGWPERPSKNGVDHA